jgi:hypothetical protein
MGLRLAVGEVTVLLGPAAARRDVMARLDDDSGRCAGGHATARVVRLAAHPRTDVPGRVAAVHAARRAGAAIVLVDRITDGLRGDDRRLVLAELLALADGALRADADGGLAPVPDLEADLDYLGS